MSCNREIETTTTTLDAQKHELMRPQEFWTSKNPHKSKLLEK
jgi:hypothetical protein